MSLVVLGLSHHGAPIDLLESVALDDAGAVALEARILASEHVTEVMVLSTCNRTEVYAESLTFHGALVDITHALADACRVERSRLQPHLYVHYEDRGIAHAFTVACGLDSMAVGEAQIVGQVRRGLARSQGAGHVGPSLNALLQRALRVAKRVHTETDIDVVSGSLVHAGLARATAALGGLEGLRVLVVGAGGMGALAATTAVREGAAAVEVVNRAEARARSLAGRVGGTWRPLADLGPALAAADVVVSSTGARGRIVTAADARTALAQRDGAPQVYVDLALPHDVDLDVDLLPGVVRVGLVELGEDLAEGGSAPQVVVARELVTAEVAGYLVERQTQAVAPTVTALRTRAGELVDAEMARLERRTPDMGERERAEVRRAVERVVDKLLHTPTVRVKELAQDGQGGSYARALSELFDLDPRDVSLVSAPPTIPGEEP
ncbi:glutamyl-tRNA reductase [Phycicoccus sp. BSK3Z-2]|uniref:Glutamyl-tRNA reductase n=1 Tax=Phycicoccus avicenniae TaxID=2828860 RepID=A0A941D7M7_9MICO|nr:glutamyl-tRNA reductase [Phycicoccus avicenniae]MBR7743305.1 glutamyl-tRNA reductase [Phycicoccus avicenniae]